MSDPNKQKLMQDYLDASAELDKLMNGDMRKAGERNDYEYLFNQIKEIIDSDSRPMMKFVMIREDMNTYLEGANGKR